MMLTEFRRGWLSKSLGWIGTAVGLVYGSRATAETDSRTPLNVSTYAGSVEGSQDGFRTQATFNHTSALAFAPDGRIFVTEANVPTFTTVAPGAHRIRVIDQNGMVSTFAGADEPGLVEGPRLGARFRGPNAIVFDHSGNIFISDRLNHRIRKIDTDGIVSTFAGSSAGYRDGLGTDAMFNSPIGMCIDQNDNLYVADFENIVVRKVTPQGEVTTYAGIPGIRGSDNGFRTTATFNSPHWVSISQQGELFVADWLNGLIRKIGTDGVVSTFVSGWQFVETVLPDSQGNVYASVPPGAGAHRLLKFDVNGQLLWSMDNPVGFQDGPVSIAQFEHYSQPLPLPSGDLLMSDGPRIRLIDVEPKSQAPPTIDCIPALTMSCDGALTQVPLSATVADADGDALTITWTVDGTTYQTNEKLPGPSSISVQSTLSLEPGVHLVTISANDGNLPPVTCSTKVTVVDNVPPVISSAESKPAVLWPPDHRLVPVTISVNATDACSTSVNCRVVSVTSNEPENGLGDGDQAPDWQLLGGLNLKLRAERSGKGEGRTYTVLVECSDASGNSTQRALFVRVPHQLRTPTRVSQQQGPLGSK